MKILTFIAGFAILSGCVLPSYSFMPRLEDYEIVRRHVSTVSVEILGERKGGPFIPGINPVRIQAVVTSAIKQTAVFRSVLGKDNADYILVLDVFRAQLWGNTEVGWTVKNRATDQIIWRKSIETEYFFAAKGTRGRASGRATDTVSQAFFENIRQGLSEISKLHLTPSSAI